MHVAIAIVVIAWMNNGIFTYLLPYFPNYMRWGLFLIWFSLALITSRKYFETFLNQAWPLLLFYFYVLFVSLFANSVGVYAKSISYLIIVYSIFLYYFDKKLQKYLIGFITIDCIIIGINTYLNLKSNPMIVRYLSTGTEVRARLLGDSIFQCVGNYGYFYSLVSIILLLTFLTFYLGYKRILSISILLAFVFLLIKASYTMAILLAFIFIFITLVAKFNKYKTVAVILLTIFSLFIFHKSIGGVFEYLADNKSLPKVVSVRFDEVGLLLKGSDLEGTDLMSRQNLYSVSFKSFLNNIFTGVINSNKEYGVGGHSAWLDLIATFGLFSILFFMFLYKAYKFCIKRLPRNFLPFVKIYWVYYITLGLLNTVLFPNMFTIWFLYLPLLINYYFNKKTEPILEGLIVQ